MKTAYIPGLDSFAIKISPGFFNNPSIGLPSTNGLMIQFSAKTGLIEALLLDNGYLTDVRTAAAGAVAAKYLSRADANIATIFGAGMQARLQLQALTLVRPITEARIWARDHLKAEQTAKDITDALGIPVKAMADAREACRDADIIVTTTLQKRRSSRLNGWNPANISPPWALMQNTRTSLIRQSSNARSSMSRIV